MTRINNTKCFNVFLLMLLCFCLVSCDTYIDLSTQDPYTEAIGKKFILQRDYYIFTFRNSSHTYIGTDSELPNSITTKYIGTKYNNGEILGIAKKGQLIRIDKFSEEKAVLAGTFNFLYVSLINESNPNFHELDATGLMNMMKNPPFTKTWSDPPIFDPQAALPLASDGVWWK